MQRVGGVVAADGQWHELKLISGILPWAAIWILTCSFVGQYTSAWSIARMLAGDDPNNAASLLHNNCCQLVGQWLALWLKTWAEEMATYC
jgi:hypothetical protein